MRRISFDKRFVNEAGNDLIPGKIHTIRQNFDFWKKFEGKEAALFTWEGKPYRSKQRVFCVKKIYHVQKLYFNNIFGMVAQFAVEAMREQTTSAIFAKNDGFNNFEEILEWFHKYPSCEMAILHFTDFRY
jgi:hypothetical protein